MNLCNSDVPPLTAEKIVLASWEMCHFENMEDKNNYSNQQNCVINLSALIM